MGMRVDCDNRPIEPMKHSELIAHMAWTIITGITKGDKLEATMHIVFNLVVEYLRQNGKMKN